MKFWGIARTGGIQCFVEARLEPLVIEARLAKPEVSASNMLILREPLYQFRAAPPDVFDIHASVSRPAAPLLDAFIPASHF